MARVFTFILLSMFLGTAGCQSRDNGAAGNKAVSPKGNASPHGKSKPDDKNVKATATPLAEQIREKKLNLSTSRTVGEVFDSYRFAARKEWRDTLTKNGACYVDFVCQLDAGSIPGPAKSQGVVQRSLYVKFSIHENGEAYVSLITVIDVTADGKTRTTNIQDEEAMLRIVQAIYDNKQIVL